ncbi:nicotinate phosphoribosyltransferase [Deinococcus yavapaiensis]|uniref:nicotinate phosphoribosyltransferase n=1 Tax=Deinococcus yavapaiensis TaxID=309889 RepID=UPI000DA1AC7B|nr:nicotinate phosphoribosyltransferase [Deinococcus yavapaiensis]
MTDVVSPLFTDLYQLTMLAGYLRHGLHEQEATFDLYIRRAPFEGGYAVWAGLETALSMLESWRFEDVHLAYLRGLGLFDETFLAYLRDWRFRATVTTFPEGRVVFPNEPLLTVTGALGEGQLVETALLNVLNFQTLVATKASRAVLTAANGERAGSVVEFGARRAQGPDGADSATRAAFVGGATGTSNVEAGMAFGIPVVGTHAHAWVEAFASELDAFRAYAAAFPNDCTLLIDTFDTLASGLPNAIRVGLEMKARGQRLRGVRLDSGDLAYLSRKCREALDAAGLADVRVVASNDLDEFVIDSVIREGGRVDVFGVGTRLVTGGGPGGGALGGVYKLVDLAGTPKMKLTADRAKSTVPGRKRVLRVRRDGRALLDVVALEGEDVRPSQLVTDPQNPLNRTRIPSNVEVEDARQVVMRDGQRTHDREELAVLRDRAANDLANLPEGTTRLLNPHVYRVGLSEKLQDLRSRKIAELEASLHS